jgi:hypothetical protein
MPSGTYPPTRRRHVEVLAFSLVALIASPLLEVYPEERVGLRGHPDLLLPPTCPSRVWFGVSCPGCGLTRSFVHLARGDWVASTACHRLGWLMACVAAVQVPYRLAALAGRERFLLPERAARWVGRTLIALLIGNWVVGLLFQL